MRKIAHFIVNSSIATVFAMLLCVGVLIYVVLVSDVIAPIGGVDAWAYLGLLLYPLLGIFVVRLNRGFTSSSSHTLFPVTLLMMGCSLSPQILEAYGLVYSLAFIVVYYVLSDTYRKYQSMGRYFVAFALLSVVTFVTPQLLLLLPFLIPCCIPLKSLHLRTICAALIGIIFPYWMAFGILFFTDDLAFFLQHFSAATTFLSPAFHTISLPVGGWVLTIPYFALQVGWALLLLIPSVANVFFCSSMKVSARANLSFVSLLAIISLLGMFLLPTICSSLLPLLLLWVAILGDSFFVVPLTRANNIFLTVLTILWVVLYVLLVWSISLAY